MKVLNDIKDTIRKCHGGDESQMEIILSDEPRLVVEAPAGCGKTTTMVSKVAYMIAAGTVPKNKKILALTFSVNAAYKMKKDISERLPAMGLEQIESPDDLNKLMYISNFHGLSRRILSLYGYLIDERLKSINDFKAINENDYNVHENYNKYGISVTDDEKVFFADFKECILKCDYEEMEKREDEYIDILVRRFFPRQCITFNGYLILTKRLLSINEQLKDFYQALYPVIIVDEFQDTNCLSWSLISMLIGNDTNLFFMGDSLQRIYGFIGAVPNLLDLAKEQYHMSKKVLTQNYRFKNNMEMLLLDKNIRENAKNLLTPNVENDARVKLFYTDTHEEECVWVADKVTHLQQVEDNCSVDDNELAALILLCDEIFGSENHVETIIWKNKYGAGAKTVGFISVHEYILCYSKKPIKNLTSELDEDGQAAYKKKDEKIDFRGGYLTQPLMTTSLGDRPNLMYDIEYNGDIIHPRKQWVWSKERLEEAIRNNDVEFNKQKDGTYWGFVRDIDEELFINNTEYVEDMSDDSWKPLEEEL